ncbi:MAG TPA: hypothetical protein VMO26_24705 [Vicinamibacterales bacterium]|nr:hypothetical protein [Vicinamibacterales bacterium]
MTRQRIKDEGPRRLQNIVGASNREECTDGPAFASLARNRAGQPERGVEHIASAPGGLGENVIEVRGIRHSLVNYSMALGATLKSAAGSGA